MANVITNFLVGIGFDFDKKSADQIGTGIDQVKSKALQLGAVVAGAFGIKTLTADFAQSADMLGKFAEVFNVSANDVQAFGNALATEGGTLQGFMSQLESIERARARIRVGDVSFFAPAGKAGINPNDIANAKTATEAYLLLADSFSKMNSQQRINAAEAIGLDEASIRLLSQGRGAVEALVAKYATIRPLTKEMTEDAAEFNRQWLELSQNVASFTDVISSELLPVINDITNKINSWLGDDQTSKLKAVAALAKKAFGGDVSPEQLVRDTGLPPWMFTENWIKEPMERYRQLDADVTRGIYNFTGLDLSGGGFGAKQPTPAASAPYDDSYLYMMQNPNGMVSEPAPAAQDVLQVPYLPQSERSQSTIMPPQSRAPAPTNQNINVTLELDGATIDRRVVRVVNGMAQTAMDDIKSSTER